MGLFGKGKDESIHHKTPCDTEGAWWAKKNPMGWGNDNARVIKRAGESSRKSNNHPTTHGSKSMWLFR